MGFTFMAAGAFGDLPPAGVGRDRIAARISLRRRFPGAGTGKGAATGRPPEEGFHEGAHHHRGRRAQRDVECPRMRHHDHLRFRGGLGLLDVPTSTPGSADTSFSSAATTTPNTGVTTE